MTTQSRSEGRIVVLGAGLAGLTAAWKMAEGFGNRVLLLEKERFSGGMAHTFSERDISYDFGSHRIHPASSAEAMNLVRHLVGEELRLRERHGRLRLCGRYMHYPPDLASFLKGLGLSNTLRGGVSFLASKLRPPIEDGRMLSYEDCMTRRAGRAIYDLFYAPYAWKVYGIDPKTLSSHAAKTRVSLKKPLAIAKDLVFPQKPEKKFFYYPERGIGTLPEELERRFRGCGGELLTNASPQVIRMKEDRINEVTYRYDGRVSSVTVDTVVSSIPLGDLIGLMEPVPSQQVAESARGLRWRAIRFLYLCVNRDFCCESETYYYPETRYIFGRISEPKRFSPYMVRAEGKTVICVEVLCGVGDRFWRMEDAELFRYVEEDLKKVGLLPSEKDVSRVFSKRLPAVYPVYDIPWPDNFRRVEHFLNGVHNLYAIGRGSLFLHDNMDHAIQMGLTLADYVTTNHEKTDEWIESLGGFRHFEVRD
jgi:protoporphyrinogen oxidase